MLTTTEKAFLAFVIIGCISLLTTFYKVAHFIYIYYIRTDSLKKYNKNGNSWALVTGSSDGIGQAMAHELCSQGFNLILHGRNSTKLSTVQSKLATEFPKTEFRTFVADAAASTEITKAAIQDLLLTIKDLNLTVLINNVGGAGNLEKAFITFEDHKSKEIDDLISINMKFTLHLTHALLPILALQKSGLIMNTGSTGSIGMPYLSVYSPTKAYLNAWGNAVSIEMQAEGHNVEVLTVMSSNTQTGQDSREATFFRPTSSTFAKAALNKIGCGSPVVVGYVGHALESAAVGLLPDWAARSMIIMVLKPFKGMNLDG